MMSRLCPTFSGGLLWASISQPMICVSKCLLTIDAEDPQAVERFDPLRPLSEEAFEHFPLTGSCDILPVASILRAAAWA